MKKVVQGLLAIVLMGLISPVEAQQGTNAFPFRDPSLSEEQRVSDLVSRLTLKEKADLVIASAGGYPKDANLYQGTKAVDNALMAVKDDGVIILLLECVDIGEPPDFSGWFKYVDLQERERHLREDFTVPGFVALKCGYDLRRVPQVLVTLPENREFAVKAGFLPAATLEEALALAENILKKPDYTVILMPDGGNTVPVLA